MGADAIKFISDDMVRPGRAALPKMQLDVMHSIIHESHVQGLKAYAHATDSRTRKRSLR